MVSTPNNGRRRSFVLWKEEKEDDRDHRIYLTLRYISIHLNGRLEQKTETFSVHATSSHGDFKWILMTQSAEAATSLQSDGVFFPVNWSWQSLTHATQLPSNWKYIQAM